MLKEKDTQQTLLPEDSHANLSPLQEKEKEQMMIATSGMKLLELSKNVNLNGSLGKMLKVLLTSTKAWSSDRCKMIWKEKVSKSNVSLFQLQASVHGIKEKESGSSAAMFPTPTSVQRPNEGNMRMMRKQVLQGNISREEATAMVGKDIFKAHGKVRMYPTPVKTDHLHNQSESIENWKKRAKEKKKQGINLHFALRHHVQMYPTPSARDYKDSTVSKSHQKRNSDSLPVKMMKMYGTPKAQDNRAALWDRGKGNLGDQVHGENNARETGGRLNPNFVEFLMGYPINWTKIEQVE